MQPLSAFNINNSEIPALTRSMFTVHEGCLHVDGCSDDTLLFEKTAQTIVCLHSASACTHPSFAKYFLNVLMYFVVLFNLGRKITEDIFFLG